MRALLLKDCYVLIGQMKTFLFMLVFFALIFRGNAGSFAIFYAMMLPVTALAYDEQAKWPQLAVMLPYSLRDIVLSKYALGWICALVISAVSLLQMFIDPESFWVVAIVFCVAMGFLAFVLPLVFWLGTEKGRMLMIALLAGIFGIISAVSFISFKFGGVTPLLLAVSLGVVLLLNLLSIALSVKLYKRRLMRG